MFEVFSPQWLEGFIQSYGLWVLFAVIMFESTGVPMPGETALVATALYAGSTQAISIVTIVAVAAVGSITGACFGYLLGRTIGYRLIVRYGRYIHLGETRVMIGEYLFLRHGGKIVFFGRFVAFLRAFASILAGANRMAWPLFLLMNALGGIIWAAVFGVGAYLLGERIKVLAAPVGVLLLLVVVGLIVVGIVFVRRHEKELGERAAAALRSSGAAPRIA